MENLEEKKIKPRKAIVAFLLSVLVVGLGQLYNGQLKKALFFFFGILIYAIGINIFCIAYFWVYVVAFIILVILWLCAVIEATLTAHKSKEYELKSYNKWYVYFLSVVIGYFAVYVGEDISKKTRYRLFKASSDTSYPNIFAGDRVLGDFGIYKHQEPTYGDLVVFLMPDGTNSVFRIVGMPNDTLSVENQLVKYKNKEFSSKLISTLFFEEYEMEEFVETLPNGVEYKIIRSKIPFYQEMNSLKETVVPSNSYFLLGDNRNLSADSRFIGFVQREQIQGKLLSVYFSKDFKRINISLSKEQ